MPETVLRIMASSSKDVRMAPAFPDSKALAKSATNVFASSSPTACGEVAVPEETLSGRLPAPEKALRKPSKPAVEAELEVVVAAVEVGAAEADFEVFGFGVAVEGAGSGVAGLAVSVLSLSPQPVRQAMLDSRTNPTPTTDRVQGALRERRN